jgi:pimeloyl-ACP methyl ester carboxylesterase
VAYFTTPDGVRLNYAEAGKGTPPLIFIHGWASNLRAWDPQVSEFGAGHRVLRMDLRGHGRSAAPARGYTIPRMAEDVAALATARRVRNAVVVGHSMGGMVALELARKHPEIAAALVQIDAPMGLGGVPKAALAEHRLMQLLRGEGWPSPALQFYAGFFQDARDTDLAARIITEAGETPRAAALASFEGLLTYKPQPAAKRIKQPALYIAAAKANARWDQLRTMIPHIQFARVVGAGHFLQLEAPDQCNAMLREFIARL